MTDCICEGGMGPTVSTYDNFEILNEIMPDFKNMKLIKRVTDTKKILYAEQAMPWPMWPRDMVFNFTGGVDYKNRALMTFQSDARGTWHGFEIPACDEENFVRMDMKKGYNFFQYLGPKKTRHIQIFESDPKVGYIPQSLLNWAMTTVLYGNM